MQLWEETWPPSPSVQRALQLPQHMLNCVVFFVYFPIRAWLFLMCPLFVQLSLTFLFIALFPACLFFPPPKGISSLYIFQNIIPSHPTLKAARGVCGVKHPLHSRPKYKHFILVPIPISIGKKLISVRALLLPSFWLAYT